MDDKAHGCAGPDRDRRLYLQVARGELVASAQDVLLRGFTDGLNEIAFTGKGQA
ncbi:MAG: hypothetical protein JWO15_2380 [Sphingomonadales bacterium]|nr:hypothetical protein [Sphingomonadales bacterium]